MGPSLDAPIMKGATLMKYATLKEDANLSA
jgi:hypothetical protein